MYKNIGVKFGDLVRTRRGIEGLSQAELAVKAFGNPDHKSRISDLERGKIPNPHQRTVDALVVALGITVEELAACWAPDSSGLPRDPPKELAMDFEGANPDAPPAELEEFLKAKAREWMAEKERPIARKQTDARFANGQAAVEDDEDGGAGGPPPAAARDAAGRCSLAVLPFDNLSDDPNQRYFADGIAEELITALSRVRWFFVIARNSSFCFRGLEAGVQEIGRKLGVRYIVAGSVRRALARLRITSHLVEVGTRAEIWSDRFEGGVEDVFDVQDRVCASIVGAIEPKLRQAEVLRARKKPTDNLDAYDRYLRALGLLTPRIPANYERALAELDRAIELDPEFALAQALSAHCRYVRIVQGWAESVASETAAMIESAEEALSKAPDDPGVLTHAGFALGWGGCGLEDAIQLLARATELNPNSAYAWYVDGWLRMQAGSPDEAVERFERALRLSPLDPISAGSAMAAAGQAMILARRYDEAVRWSARAAREAPDLAYAQRALAASLALAGRAAEADRASRALLAIEPGFSVGRFLARLPLRETAAMRALCEGLRLAGLPETAGCGPRDHAGRQR